MMPMAPIYTGGATTEVYSSVIRAAEIEGTSRLVRLSEAPGWLLTSGPCALEYAMKQIADDIESEPEEDRPTPFALESATRLLREAQSLSFNAIAPSSVEGFEGDLILHWELEDRGAALVFPAWANKPVRLYREELAQGIPVQTELQDDPTGSDIVNLMTWLQNLD